MLCSNTALPPKILYSLVFILRYISSIRSPQIPVASRKHACHMRVIGLRCLVLKWPARVRRQLGYQTGADACLHARLSGARKSRIVCGVEQPASQRGVSSPCGPHLRASTGGAPAPPGAHTFPDESCREYTLNETKNAHSSPSFF